jgi:UPF0755 protein
MLKTIKQFVTRVFWGMVLASAAIAAWFASYVYSDLSIRPPIQFSLKHGSSLRSATHQMQAAGLLDSPLRFELLARMTGNANRVQAGNYEIVVHITPLSLLEKITSGERGQDQIMLQEGWTFSQMRAALDAHIALKHDTSGLTEAEIASRLGVKIASVEGMFFPDTYYFVNGSSDLSIMRRAQRSMQSQLDALWAARPSGLPFDNAYQALILASVVEKETGQPGERGMIAAVFINRLKIGMKLQTDPTVIYGLGAQFDGNLRKRDLLADGPYNTYTRAGLPPTPIAMPGLGALTAALNPVPSKALYFVARGDGTSQFSASLAEHERAVTRYQRHGNR